MERFMGMGQVPPSWLLNAPNPNSISPFVYPPPSPFQTLHAPEPQPHRGHPYESGVQHQFQGHQPVMYQDYQPATQPQPQQGYYSTDYRKQAPRQHRAPQIVKRPAKISKSVNLQTPKNPYVQLREKIERF